MSALPSSVVKTSAVVIAVSLDPDANRLASDLAESGGLRFRHYLSVERLLEAATQNHVG